MLKIVGHDNAILGPAMVWLGHSRAEVLVYDGETIRQNLIDEGMPMDEAREYIEFNIEGAYVGEGTPVIVWIQDIWDE
jgi:hypothetical protein